MGEVALTFDIPVNRTVEKRGTSTASIRTTGNEKSSFTVVLACHANGEKLPPMVIFKRKILPKQNFPAGVVIKVNPKGWMDEEKMSEWLREIYVKRPGRFFHTAPSIDLRLHARWSRACWMPYSPSSSIRTLKKKNSRDTWTGNELKKLALICTAH